MPSVEHAGACLSYEVIDIVPPWIRDRATIVFYHGVSTSRAVWSDWIPALCDRFRLLTFDTRGFGQSSVDPTMDVWTLELLVEDLLAIADDAGLQSFHLVGESAGGTAAMAAAARHPDRIAGLLLSNAAARGTAVRNIRGFWREGIAEHGQDDWAGRMMDWRFFPGALPPEKASWFRDQQATCSAEATLALAELLLRTDILQEVQGIRSPTLILSPDSSPFISVEMAVELRDRIPGSELQVFPHSRHGLPFSHGRECAAAARAFLERRFGPGAA